MQEVRVMEKLEPICIINYLAIIQDVNLVSVELMVVLVKMVDSNVAIVVAVLKVQTLEVGIVEADVVVEGIQIDVSIVVY